MCAIHVEGADNEVANDARTAYIAGAICISVAIDQISWAPGDIRAPAFILGLHQAASVPLRARSNSSIRARAALGTRSSRPILIVGISPRAAAS
jgi:hypothetical protein